MINVGLGIFQFQAGGFRASASFSVADDFSTGVVGTITTSGAEGAVSLVGGAVTNQAGTNSGLFSITTGLEVTLDPQTLGAGLTNDGDSTSTSYSIQLTDTVSTIDVTVTVTLRKPDQAPVAAGALADLTLTQGVAITPVDTSVVFDDPGDTLTFSASNLPAGLAINSTTGLITGAPTELVTGQAVVITATDTAGQTATSGFQITVQVAAPAPAFTVAFVFPWGQSNMGTGTSPGTTTFPSNSFYWDRDTNAPVSNTGNTREWSSSNSSPGHGPAVQWANRFRADNPTVKIVVIDHHFFAQDIQAIDSRDEDGLWSGWMQAIEDAYDHYTGLGETISFYQLMSQHGESNDADSANYAFMLPQFVDDWRSEVQTRTGVNVDEVPWTFGQPTAAFIADRNMTGPEDIPQINDGMAEQRLYTAVADTRNSAVVPGDTVHYSAAGCDTNGDLHYDRRSVAVANTSFTFNDFTGSPPTFDLTENEIGTLNAATGTAPTFNLERT